jgi:phosphate transport system substrate-binding protein
LPAVRIEVLGPPPTSGTRDSFIEQVLEPGCGAFAWIKSLKDVDERRFKQVCTTIREDGVFVEAGENDNLIVQKLAANRSALGVFGYSFLEENTNVLHGSMIEGVAPDFETIASGEYPVSRAMFIYAKKAHVGVIPGMKEFIAEFTSEKAFGEDGYLADKGLVPAPKAEREKVRRDAAALVTLKSL